MPIIRSSIVLYKWLRPVLFGALVFKLSVWCGAEGYVSGLRAAAEDQRPSFKPKHKIRIVLIGMLRNLNIRPCLETRMQDKIKT